MFCLLAVLVQAVSLEAGDGAWVCGVTQSVSSCVCQEASGGQAGVSKAAACRNCDICTCPGRAGSVETGICDFCGCLVQSGTIPRTLCCCSFPVAEDGFKTRGPT